MSIEQQITIDEYAMTLIRVKARQLIGKYGFTRSDREDLEQDLSIFVLERMRHFDPRRGSDKTFIDRIVNRKVISIIRGRLAASRDYRRASSLNDAALDEEGKTVERGDTIPDDADRRIARGRDVPAAMDLALDVLTVLATLDPELKRVCDLVIAGTKKDASEKLGLSKSGLRDRVLKLREVFSSAGLRDYLTGGVTTPSVGGVSKK